MLIQPLVNDSICGKLRAGALSIWIAVCASTALLCFGQFRLVDGWQSTLFLNTGGIGLISCLGLSELRRRTHEREIQRLREFATTDPLTGAGNRRSFDQELSRKITQFQRYNTPCSLLIIDADHFKSVNDTWGHAVGDIVLKALVQAMTSTLRDIDLLFRIGGEEFGALLPETGATHAVIAAERIRRAVNELEIDNPVNNKKLRVSVSIGGADIQFVDCAERWYKRADVALYEAKERGRNRVEFYAIPTEASSRVDTASETTAHSE